MAVELAQLAGVTEPLRVDAAPVDGRPGRANLVVTAGQLLLVWFPAFMLLAPQMSSPAEALAATAPLTIVWFVALRSALSSVPYALGPGVAAAVGGAIGLVAASAVVWWTPGLDVPPLVLLEIAAAVSVLLTAWDLAVRRGAVGCRRILIVGGGPSAETVVEEINGAGGGPFHVLGVVHDEPQSVPDGAPLLGDLAALVDIVEVRKPDIVVLAGPDPAPALDRLLDVARVGFKVVAVPHFVEHAFGRVPLQQLTPAWFMSVLHLRQTPYSRFSKRVFDLVGASLVLAFTAPLLPLIALLVKLTPGPVIYRQVRVGEGGRTFTMLKFRSMRTDAEQPGQPRWAAEQDGRVTPVGRILRGTRLDELPQLWNVLKGDMSLVGPRPERPEFLELLGQAVPFWSRRLLVKPGVTGWAQIRRGYTADCGGTAEKLSYDLWYLRNRNVIVDLAICAKTVSKLLFPADAR